MHTCMRTSSPGKSSEVQASQAGIIGAGGAIISPATSLESPLVEELEVSEEELETETCIPGGGGVGFAFDIVPGNPGGGGVAFAFALSSATSSSERFF